MQTMRNVLNVMSLAYANNHRGMYVLKTIPGIGTLFSLKETFPSNTRLVVQQSTEPEYFLHALNTTVNAPAHIRDTIIIDLDDVVDFSAVANKEVVELLFKLAEDEDFRKDHGIKQVVLVQKAALNLLPYALIDRAELLVIDGV